ncbi:immunoglobulin superfamily DCC subclass member 3-like [Gouania willdenowi]|uniref:immunoglobulin superfamily DCC subclass member 3-like n=1 Tax=Gouania willdenowi TaxID=441366 RepID=UPI00105619AA|nr:immunoglobulin superfamily DCC subclass member 3-like [Gouania willdenowi]
MLKISGVLSTSELAFLSEPSDVIAVRDRPLLLDCAVEGAGPISITWRRNGIPMATGVKAVLFTNGTLLIHNLHAKRRSGTASNTSDAGEYECVAENRYGKIVSRKARVRVASLPKFLSHPQSMAVGEGGVARFTCQVNGIPEAEITWERDRRPLGTSEPRYTLLPHGVLQVSAVRQNDVGRFRCVAKNIANTRYSEEAELTVTGPENRKYREPVILSGPQNLTISVHQTAILECIATGNPRPIVSWSRLDGRSIGVEGVQVLGTGNLMISDASLQHSGVYVCSANRPGSRSRRTALGRLVVQAPPLFLQWPQSLSSPVGGRAEFICSASGVPDPHLVWLKNGKLLPLHVHAHLGPGNTTLTIAPVTAEDEAIYQCVAENSAGTNQASARLAVSQAPPTIILEGPPTIRAAALTSTNLRLSWEDPGQEAGLQTIAYVLHIRRLGEPDSAELQEAVSSSTYRHDITNLEPGTTYSIYVKAYSPRGGTRRSNTVTATTLGGVPSAPRLSTKVLNRTALQLNWELPSKPGTLEGFKLEYHRVSNSRDQGQETFPGTINTHTITKLEAAAVYQLTLWAFNGNGDGASSQRLVSLSEGEQQEAACPCTQASSSLLMVHSGSALVLFCLIFILLGNRHFFCRKSENRLKRPESIELDQKCDSAHPVMVEAELSSPGSVTG